MLHQRIKEEIKTALRGKDQVKLTALRGLLAAFTNELVAKRRKPDEILSDDEALAVIRRAVKQRQDAISQFTAGGRADLAEAEQAELTILQNFLPTGPSVEEIEARAKAKMAELGITDKSQAGRLVGAVIKEFVGRADGGQVKQIVDRLLS